MFTTRIKAIDIEKLRIEAEYYQPEKMRNISKLKKCCSRFTQLSELCEFITDGTHQTPSYVESGVRFLSSKNIGVCEIDFDDTKQVTQAAFAELKRTKCAPLPGDILLSKNGKIGTASVYKESHPEVALFVSVAMLRYKASLDVDFLAMYLNSNGGWWQFSRSSKTGVITNLHLEEIREIDVPLFDGVAQKYIGDKVRQAEQLRTWVKAMGAEVESLVSNETMKTACATPEKKHNRPQLDDLTHRLDPKYYGNRAVAVFRRAKAIGKPLASLITGIANGFEERVFFDTGRDYITVTEVSSGRLELSSAPKISHATEVPDKAIIHERCVLVVRTGSIGTAVKVDARDRGAVISSHLIRLEFDDEADAAAVAAYLCSTAGKVLQQKISYGAVQPQIGQDELLALPVPQFVLDSKDQILVLITEQESAIRASKALTTTAKFLVEALIEGQLTEAELIAAEQALQAGNDQPDRQILNRLKTDGVDGNGQPLFADLDQLYSLLEQAGEQ